jgi:CMD domain protein
MTTLSPSAPTGAPAADLIDRLAGLAPGSPVHALRHRREKVVAATQGSHDGLFDPALPGLSLAERLLVAVYACRLTPAPGLAAHYRARLTELGVAPALVAVVDVGDPQQLDDERLRAMLTFTRTLILKPIEGDQAALRTLPEAGIDTPSTVTLAQLIAFISYQTRLVAGLAALAAASASATSESAR